ncbi:MAG: hypothetical protein K5656_09935 [Lachnospiraceae bacterium]|nr:hypothetical protein [Lachnospiraceae bacterium]
MKKYIVLVLAFALVFSFAGCGSSESTSEAKVDQVQQDLIKYVETDLPAIKANESAAVERYNEVSAGITDMKRKEISSAFKDEIIPTYTNFVKDLEALSPATSEVQALKATYLEGAKAQLEGMTALNDAISANDSDAAKAANEKIVEGKTKIEQHRSDIVTLASEHNINVTTGETTTVADATAEESTTEK